MFNWICLVGSNFYSSTGFKLYCRGWYWNRLLMYLFIISFPVTLGFCHFSVDQQDMKQIYKSSYVYGFSVAVREEKV